MALASLRHTYNIDDDRIYATGFSNGGMFTYLLWAKRPNVFAAFAPVAGRPPKRTERPSTRTPPARTWAHASGSASFICARNR